MSSQQQNGQGQDRDSESAGSHSRAVEDYLKAIRHLQQEGTPVSTSSLAQQLDRSPASVTNMIKSLADQGLVEHQPYHGVRLSAAGERSALRIIRRHRVIEAYLIEELGYSWDRVHAEAERREHAASDELVERMADALGQPALDPHGSPIPTAQGEFSEQQHPVLADMREGMTVIVREVSDSDEGRLRYLAELGLFPGTRLEVLAPEPYDGPMRIRLKGEERSLGRNLAEIVRVEPVNDSQGVARNDSA
jgi:DtxR family Mn-dependent transcriptional regulator